MTEAAVFMPPARRELDEVSHKIAAWMSDRMPEASDLRVTDLSHPAGAGQSNETILFEAEWRLGDRTHTEGFALRMEPGPYRVYMELDFRGQYDLQRAIADHGVVPVPDLLWFEEDPSLFGARFFLMRRLRGHVAVSHPPYITHGWIADASTDERRRIWHNAVEALARIHAVPIEWLTMLDRPQYGATGWEQEWNYWMASHAWSRGDRELPTCDRVIDWLEANMPEDRPSGLCWGDSRIGNLFFDDAFAVSAVMDWEGASLGGNLQDLGCWLFLDRIMETAAGRQPDGFGTRAETIALWESVSGASARDVFWYEVFAGFKLASHVNRKLGLDGNSRPGFNYGDNPAIRLLASIIDLPPPQPLL